MAKKGETEPNKKTAEKEPKKRTKKVTPSTGLTDAQQEFVNGLFAGLSQREAYRRAYKVEGWKDSHIDSKASALANNGKVRSRLEAMQQAYQIRLENKYFVNKDWVMERLIAIADANITDFLAIEQGKICVGVNRKTLEPIFVDGEIIRTFPTDEVVKTKYNAVAGIKQGKNGVEIKFYDKPKALELIGKELGMFKDKIEIETAEGVEEFLKRAKRSK